MNDFGSAELVVSLVVNSGDCTPAIQGLFHVFAEVS